MVDSFNMFESEPSKESSVYYISSTVLIISNTGMIFFKKYTYQIEDPHAIFYLLEGIEECHFIKTTKSAVVLLDR